jgi:hypothetical protein
MAVVAILENGDGGHHGKGRPTSSFVFFRFSMTFLGCVPTYIKIG